MADEDLTELDVDDTLDWFYVEDDFPLADELAETQIPDPGYAGTQWEIDAVELSDFDVFDFWDDLAYGVDTYWDYASDPDKKRKRPANSADKHVGEKRRKLTLQETGGGNVRFMKSTSLWRIHRTRPVDENLQSYALLPDWRTRFANAHGITASSEMPVEMKQAAEADVQDTPPKPSAARGAFVFLDEDGEDEQDDDDDADADDLQAQLASLDPETLKSVLRAKLGDAGLEGLDEGVFMQAISKMLAGEEDEGGATAALADNLLHQASEGNDAALSGWLSQQGVALEDADGHEDEEADVPVHAAPIVTTATTLKTRHDWQSSPSDSVIDASKAPNGTTIEMPLHSSSPTTASRKRAATPEGAAKEQPVRKSKKSMRETVASGNGNEDDDIHAVKTRASTAISEQSSNHHTEDSSTKDSEMPPADATTKHSVPQPARQTRKRKAAANDDDNDDGATVKKQARKVSGPAEAVGRRTRSTRAATKAGK